MANVLDRTTLEFIPSVNTPDYPEDKYIINPDMSAVASVPQKYWKTEGNAVVSASPEECAAIDAIVVEKPVANCPYGYTDKCEYVKE